MTHTLYNIDVDARRRFEGFGPTVTWDAAHTLVNLAEAGQVDLNWSATAGVAFGRRKAAISASQMARAYELRDIAVAEGSGQPTLITTTIIPIAATRSENATVPLFAASLGFSYKVDRFKIGAGYSWERYFNAIDGGFTERKTYDRTIDGPYLKVSVGFGG